DGIIAPSALRLSIIYAGSISPVRTDQVVRCVPGGSRCLASVVRLKSPADGGVSSRNFLAQQVFHRAPGREEPSPAIVSDTRNHISRVTIVGEAAQGFISCRA